MLNLGTTPEWIMRKLKESDDSMVGACGGNLEDFREDINKRMEEENDKQRKHIGSL